MRREAVAARLFWYRAFRWIRGMGAGDLDTGIVLPLITLLGVAVTAFVTWLIAQRRLMGVHVTAERRQWRDNIRKKALEVHDAIMSGDTDGASKLQNEFRALLNPFDKDDREILDRIDATGCNGCRKDRARDFGRSISLLLKHDWERVKLEAGFSPLRWFVDAKRSSFEEDLRFCEKFGIKFSGVVYLVLLLPVIVGLYQSQNVMTHEQYANAVGRYSIWRRPRNAGCRRRRLPVSCG